MSGRDTRGRGKGIFISVSRQFRYRQIARYYGEIVSELYNLATQIEREHRARYLAFFGGGRRVSG